MKYSIIIAGIFLFAVSTFGFVNPDETCCTKNKSTMSKICDVPESNEEVSGTDNTSNTVAALSVDGKNEKKKDSSGKKSVKEKKGTDEVGCCSAKGEKKQTKKVE
jgi:hypothetical protein